MSVRVSASRLIGRGEELAELRGALAEAAEGHPALAFVAGDSGVGKTRLVSELAEHARASGARVLSGDCVELGEGELPYAPLVAALRPLAREGDPVLDELPAATRAELAALAPELGAPGAERPDEERGAAQRRLFEALLSLLERLGAAQPVLLLLEDVHWADRSTRAFLAFLGRSLAGERVLAVATYRSDELHRRHPLRPLLAELERDPRARRVELRPLAQHELAAQLEDILGEPPPAELVERLYARTEGNPLFTEELVAAGPDGHAGLPPTLRDALMLRVERLSEPAQELLRLLAVARRADDPLLERAGGFDRRELREALREAVAGHIVVADGEAYRFRHALLREVVHDDLLPGEHAELHLQLAQALRERAASGDDGVWVAVGMAHHFFAAGDQPAALAAAVHAAERSVRVYAAGEAAALLERALELWERVPDAESVAGARHVDVLIDAAHAHEHHGDDARRLDLLGRALEEIDETAEPRKAAAVLGDMASAQWALGRGEESRATLRRGLALVPSGDCPERAQLLGLQVAFLMLQGRYGEVRRAAAEALSAAESSNAPWLRARILNRLGVSLFALGEQEEGTAALKQAIALARERGDGVQLAFAIANYADSLHVAGRSREAMTVLDAAEAEIAATDRVLRWLGLQKAEIALDTGDWVLAESKLPARGTFTGTTRADVLLHRAELALGRGDVGAARAPLEEAERLLAASLEPQFLARLGSLWAELERRSGDIASARAAVDEAIDRIQFCSEDAERLAIAATAGVTVEADAAQLARDRGEPVELERAAMLLAMVRACAGHGRPGTRALLATAEAEALRAGLELERDATDDDEWDDEPSAPPTPAAAWAAAAAAWEALERPYRAAIARWREAEAHVRADERDAAPAAARRAAETARRLGAAWLVEEVLALAARARLRLDPDVDARPAEPADEPFGLTPRERQVLALLARGATNREIGAELYMAEKTASVHVSRILAKLDVRSRTEAAAVAHRQGLEQLV